MSFIYALDLIGTFVFAVSGTLTANKQKFDVFGVFVIALVTAVGGGTLRDILIGSQPVGWMRDLNYLIVISCGCIGGIIFKSSIQHLRRTMFLFDTIGIGLFTILGLQKTLDLNISPVIAVLMGSVSAVFGGVIRDVLCNEVPLIFRKEIYATACIFGACLFLLLEHFAVPENVNMLITIFAIIILRTLAVRYHWSLPVQA